MNISEIPNDIVLTLPKFNCDTPLGDIPTPLPSQYFYMAFSAPPRSGKTSTAISLLTTKTNKKSGKRKIYRGVFDNIIVVAPKNSLKSLKKSPFDELDEDKIYNELDYESLEEIYSKILEYHDEDENTLLYIDDMASRLKDHQLLDFFNMMVCNRRHLKLSIMILTQYLNSIPLSNRRLLSHCFLWKSNNKKEYDSIYNELIPMSKKEFEQICRYCFKKKHDFIFMDCDECKLYRNFNLLKFDDN